MRNLTRILGVVFALSAVSAAQPKDGDLILSFETSHTWPAGVLVVDPISGKATTLTSFSGGGQTPCVRMAENNQDLLVMRHDAGWFRRVSSFGIQTTVLAGTSGLRGWPRSFELDHDDTWIVCGMEDSTLYKGNWVWSLRGAAGSNASITTLFQFPGAHNTQRYLEDLAIDRDPSAAAPYVLAMNHLVTTMQTDKLYGADRKGILTTLVSGIGQPLLCLRCIELDPCTGDYLTCTSLIGPYGKDALCIVRKDGKVRTLGTAVSHPEALRIMQDGTAWVAEYSRTNPRVLRVSVANGAVITMHALNLTQVAGLQCIEVYGSRRLVCNLPSPATNTVRIRVQCGSPFVAPGITQYALAASFSRRPGVRMPNGEFLNVTSDPLFYATALNLLPGVFVNFRGVLGQGGVNQQPISVNIPPPVRGSGITVFVAGVIYNAGFIVQVTNSHWFVM